MSTADESTIYSYLRNQGLNASAASGVMGNLEVESGFNPGITNGIGAFGLAQWLGGRKSALISYANSRGLSPSSLQAQLGYLWQEISSGSEGVTPASLNAAGSPQAAAALFDNNFERPGKSDTSGPTRQKDAANIYNQFSGSTPIDTSGLSGLTQTSASSGASAAPTSQGANGFPSGSDIIGIIDQSLTLQDFNVLHPGQSLAQDAGAIALRTVLVLVGLILLIFGLVEMVERAAPGTPVPVPV